MNCMPLLKSRATPNAEPTMRKCELMEWKKVKFMERRVGEDFDGLIVSVTKYGFFVELTDLFVEGLVPLNTLAGDYFTYHETRGRSSDSVRAKPDSLGDRIRGARSDRITRRKENPIRGDRRPPAESTKNPVPGYRSRSRICRAAVPPKTVLRSGISLYSE